MPEISLVKIAELVGGEVKGNGEKKILGAAPFENAGESDITYAGTAAFLKQIQQVPAGAVLVPRNWSAPADSGQHDYVLVDNPQLAFLKVLEIFCSSAKPESGISPHACIGKNPQFGKDVFIAHFAVIGNNVRIGDRARIHANTVIGDNVVIGDDALIDPNVTIFDRCLIGSRVIIHAGAVIGSDGFGFVPDGEAYRKIPHVGIVQIDDDVEIGANVTVDRATFGKTHICRGVKTDNLVHIAHNVTVGENSLLVAQVGISGSVSIGKHAVLAGQAGISGHLSIGDNVTVGPQAGIAKSIADGEVISGSPGIPHKVWLRVQRVIPMLPEMKKKLGELEKKIAEMTQKAE